MEFNILTLHKCMGSKKIVFRRQFTQIRHLKKKKKFEVCHLLNSVSTYTAHQIVEIIGGEGLTARRQPETLKCRKLITTALKCDR
jgi:hypothetical protein